MRLKLISRLGFGLGMIAIVGYVVYMNLAPGGAQETLVLEGDKLQLGPQDRVQNGNTQVDDLVYFQTPMKYHWDSARLKIKYQISKSENDEESAQEWQVGFKDSEVWHYQMAVAEAPFAMTNVKFTIHNEDSSINLLQKSQKYSDWGQFVANPPTDTVIGTYNQDPQVMKNDQMTIDNYVPKTTDTTIDVPLRGRHVMYVYLKGEKFKIKFWLQDLNWYKDPDTASIRVYKQNDLVYTALVDDDGIDDDSQTVLPSREAEITNPGKALPEAGVYKVVVDMGEDMVIRKISTPLSKIVFEGPIYPVSNAVVYKKLVEQTQENTIYTNAVEVSALTYHPEGVQKLLMVPQEDLARRAGANGQLLIDEVKIEKTKKLGGGMTKITVPKSDVKLNGKQGYFAFGEEQFFEPLPFKVAPITNSQEAEGVDYILTSFRPHPAGEVELEYDLTDAVVSKNKLSWLLMAPHLKDNGGKIRIDKIEILFTKNPWRLSE